MANKTDGVALYVAPNGDDHWSGTRAEPSQRGTNGPLRTVKGAQKKMRQLIAQGPTAPVRVALRGGNWHFQQRWVNGARRLRPRLPREGLYRIERLVGVKKTTPYNQGQDRFAYAKGDLDPAWRNLNDVEVVALCYWTESRMWIKGINGRRRLVTFDRKSSWR